MSPLATRSVFAGAIFAGSFLLFLVQPMVARMALPRLGGAPAVWNSAMLAYQALLLAGYGYAHGLRRLPLRRQALVHLLLLLGAAAWLPIGLVGWQEPTGASAAIWVPALLAASIGPLFLAIAAQAPLLQRWFASASGGEDPYPLYAASNLGSFAGLLAYPLLVEPAFTLRVQSWAWSAGYAAVALLVLLCALALRRAPEIAAEAEAVPAEPPPTRARVLLWIALSAVPSGLMLATSTYITTDVVAMPLLWVMPLGLYLLSYTVAFAARRAVADVLTRVAPVTVLLFGGVMMGGYAERPYLNAFIALSVLFMAAVALHTRLYRTRPEPARLTGFYLATAFGGVLGGIFSGLLAPLVFDWTWEFPLLVLAAAALIPLTYLTAGLRALWHLPLRPYAYLLLIALLAAVVALRVWGPEAYFGEGHMAPILLMLSAIGLFTLGARLPYLAVLLVMLALFGGLRALTFTLTPEARTRSYFGVYTVGGEPGRRSLTHGTTLHGVQLTGSEARERTPTTYYARGSGVGDALENAELLFGNRARIGVVGLGTGTLACYARPGQDWRFYEIDPAVVRIARDSGHFSFLSRCLPGARVVLGDARLSLSRAAPRSLDILALDAFSSDAVPIHLLTREAFAAYGRVLPRSGLLLVHISNRFLDLRPVVAAAARDGGWRAFTLLHDPSTLDESATMSLWVAMSRDPRTMSVLYTLNPEWRPLGTRGPLVRWTDDYATILPLIAR